MYTEPQHHLQQPQLNTCSWLPYDYAFEHPIVWVCMCKIYQYIMPVGANLDQYTTFCYDKCIAATL